MDDTKRELNKQRRSRNDLVRQAVFSYLQKRNYPIRHYNKLSSKEFELENLVECEVSRPNSILYSCFNSDPMVIDQTFIKFTNWLKELHKQGDRNSDLNSLTGPLFCHLYFEILRGGHTDGAASFFNNHLQTVEKYKTNCLVMELINAITSNSSELLKLKEIFRSHKYSVSLCSNSVNLLKQFLSESAHIVLLQALQNYFILNEIGNDNKDDELCNNRIESTLLNLNTCKGTQELIDAISALRLNSSPMFVCNLQNTKDEVTAGLLNRQHGISLFSFNNSVIVRSLIASKQLEGTNFIGDIAFRGHNKRIYDLSFVHDPKCVLSASEDKTIRLFDLSEHSQKMVFKGHDYPVYCVHSSSTGQTFISGSYDHTARLWTLDRRDALRVFVGHTQEITSVNMHWNCTYLATGSADKNVRLWNVGDAMPVRLFFGSKGTIYSVIFNNKGNYIISASSDKKVRIWDLVSCKELAEIDTDSELVTHLSIDKDDKLLLTGTSDGVVKYWDFDELVKAGDNNEHIKQPVNQHSLNSRLLNIEYFCETFGFLTYQPNISLS